MSLNNTSGEMAEDSGRNVSDNISPKLQARKSTRQSTIFRKDLIGSPCISSSPFRSQESNIPSSSSISNPNTPNNQDEPRILLSAYVKALETEKELWSLTRRSRSDKYHELDTKLKSKNFDLITMDSCAHLLTEEDRKFMSERPYYVQIANDAADLKEELIIAMGIRQSLLEGANTLILDYATKLDAVDCKVANLD